MKTTIKKLLSDRVIDTLLDAQKNMASSEMVDAKGLILLSRFILRLLNQLDDEVVELSTEADEKWS